MNINVKIDGHHCSAVGYFTYRHFTDGMEEGTIWLHSCLCDFCNDHMLDVEDYYHILEHEYVELLSARTAFQDQQQTIKWNGKGFNKIMKKAIPDGVAFHVHGKRISMVDYT